MKRKIKIVIEIDDNKPFQSSDIILSVDDRPVGCIQELNLSVDVNKEPSLELVFPDLENLKIDPKYRDRDVFKRDVNWYFELLSITPNIKTKTRSIDDGEDVVPLKEVGTNGNIDYYPISKIKQ